MLVPFTESSGTTFTEMNKEIWRDIPGYEGLYEISNYAKIRSLHKKHYMKDMSPVSSSNGYKCLSLCKNGVSKTFKRARLVAMVFIPNPHNLPEVDHIDGTRDNDVAWNLRWVTHAENINNPITRERFRQAALGERNNFYGRTHSEKARKIISEKNKGRCAGDKNPMFGVHRFGESSPIHFGVIQYSKEGEFIKMWSCAMEAERVLGISSAKITSVCRHYKGRKTAGGFKWEYKDENKRNGMVFEED